MSRIYDTFLYNGEADILECRLTELDAEPVYRFVIIEANVDHRGRSKPSRYLEQKERFAPWEDRIHHVVADVGDPQPADSIWEQPAWEREHRQREGAWQGIADAEPDDTILHGDVDEIPAFARDADFPFCYDQRMFYFAADWEAPSWRGTVGTQRRWIKSFAWLREQRTNTPPLGNGWHLSWLGGPEAIQAKLDATPHTEPSFGQFIRDGLANHTLYEKGQCWGWTGLVVDHVQQLWPVDVDETWPKWIFRRQCPASWLRPR
jgi:beta-1,4-mannosyl-glycoprotein beta-1,4-N-acetylglucosaminyltransferase